MRKRIVYAQNFLKNRKLISNLINKSSITEGDIAYEIGAGQGIITQELLKKSKKVVAFEIDKNLFDKLTQRFANQSLLELKQGNFLTYSLPSYEYKVFSNIPFNITSGVVKKLTQAKNPPKDTYLIVQKEAAKKFAGKPYDNKNSQMAVLLKPWFDLQIFYEFKQDDFFPKPQVETVLMRIKKLEIPLIKNEDKNLYQDFVVYVFNQFKPNITEGLSKITSKQNIIRLAKEIGFSPNAKPSELNFKDWINLFNLFLNMPQEKQNIVEDLFTKQIKQQENIEKIYRTRVDKDWKKFRK